MPRVISSIDIGKYLACILIVVLHCHPLDSFPELDYYLTCFCRIAVPFFVLSSSYFFFRGSKDIRLYIRRLLVLYLCWFILELPDTIHRFFFESERSLAYNCFLFFRGLLINSTFHASWFITALWQGVLIVWWLSKRINQYVLYAIGIVCFLIACMWSMYREVIDGTVIWPAFKAFGIVFAPANSFIVAIPYCIIGKYIAEHPNLSIKRPGILFPLFFIMALEVLLCRNIGWMSDCYLSLILVCPILFLLCLNWDVAIRPDFSKYLRNCSILIYLLHLPIKNLLTAYTQLPMYGTYTFFLVFICSMLFATLFIIASERIRFLKYFY